MSNKQVKVTKSGIEISIPESKKHLVPSLIAVIETVLDETIEVEDLEPLGDVVYFGGSRMHKLNEAAT